MTTLTGFDARIRVKHSMYGIGMVKSIDGQFFCVEWFNGSGPRWIPSRAVDLL